MNYLLQFFISFLISIFAVWLAKIFGIKFKLFDIPEDGSKKIKIHHKPIPLVGGLAMFFVFMVVFFIFAGQQDFLENKVRLILFSALLIFSIGFFDDLKWKNHFIKPRVKLYFLVLFSFFAALILLKAGIKIQFFEELILGLVLAIFYIMALINVIDFQDGIDGLAGGMTAISLIGFFLLFLFAGNILAAVMSVVLLGAILGFLVFNFPPASVFMGDSGAYFLGFSLAVLAMIFSKPYDILSIISPILIIGLPIFDMAYVIIKRLKEKKSLIVGSRDHFYDFLHFKKGFTVKQVLLIYCVMQAIVVTSGLFLSTVV